MVQERALTFLLGSWVLVTAGCECPQATIPSGATAPMAPPSSLPTTAAPTCTQAAAQAATAAAAPSDSSTIREGVFVKITGHYVSQAEASDYGSANLADNLFEVTSVDGRTVKERVELVDAPTELKRGGARTLDGYFYKEVKSSSIVPGFHPQGTQGGSFGYTMMFRVKPGAEPPGRREVPHPRSGPSHL